MEFHPETFYKFFPCISFRKEISLGINVDPIPFDEKIEERFLHGLYYFSFENFPKFTSDGRIIAIIKIPLEDPIFKIGDKFKSPRIYVEKIMDFDDFLENRCPKCMLLEAAEKDRYALHYFPKYFWTSEFCFSTVTENGLNLQYVPKELRTLELCLAAVKQNGEALKYVPKELKTSEICHTAVMQNGHALGSMNKEDLTPEFCLMAVTQHGYAFQYVPNHLITAEFCLIAVTQDGYNIMCVPKKFMTPELCLIAVTQQKDALQFIPKHLRTEEICLVAAGL